MYKVELLKFGDNLENLLNRLSSEGYEFVGIYNIPDKFDLTVIFKATTMG